MTRLHFNKSLLKFVIIYPKVVLAQSNGYGAHCATAGNQMEINIFLGSGNQERFAPSIKQLPEFGKMLEMWEMEV